MIDIKSLLGMAFVLIWIGLIVFAVIYLSKKETKEIKKTIIVKTNNEVLNELENNIFMLVEGTFGQQIQIVRQLLEKKFQEDSLLKERIKLDLIPLLEKYIELTKSFHILIETKPNFNYSEEDEKITSSRVKIKEIIQSLINELISYNEINIEVGISAMKSNIKILKQLNI